MAVAAMARDGDGEAVSAIIVVEEAAHEEAEAVLVLKVAESRAALGVSAPCELGTGPAPSALSAQTSRSALRACAVGQPGRQGWGRGLGIGRRSRDAAPKEPAAAAPYDRLSKPAAPPFEQANRPSASQAPAWRRRQPGRPTSARAARRSLVQALRSASPRRKVGTGTIRKVGPAKLARMQPWSTRRSLKQRAKAQRLLCRGGDDGRTAARPATAWHKMMIIVSTRTRMHTGMKTKEKKVQMLDGAGNPLPRTSSPDGSRSAVQCGRWKERSETVRRRRRHCWPREAPETVLSKGGRMPVTRNQFRSGWATPKRSSIGHKGPSINAGGNMAEFEEATERKRTELQLQINEAEGRLRERQSQMDVLHREAGDLAAETPADRRGGGGGGEAERLVGVMAKELQAFIESLEEGSEARERAYVLLSRAATASAKADSRYFDIATDAEEDEAGTEQQRTTWGGSGSSGTRKDPT